MSHLESFLNPPLQASSSQLKGSAQDVRLIQDMLKKNGVKMSAIEIRELIRTNGLAADEKVIKSYVRQLRQGF